MFLEVSRLTYHSPITIEALTYRVLLGNPLRQLSEVPCHSILRGAVLVYRASPP